MGIESSLRLRGRAVCERREGEVAVLMRPWRDQRHWKSQRTRNAGLFQRKQKNPDVQVTFSSPSVSLQKAALLQVDSGRTLRALLQDAEQAEQVAYDPS
jgi:hypothetical protein